jgi:hypothetical protein
MKTLLPALLLLLLTPALSSGQSGSNRFADLKSKIDALLKDRQNPTPLPERPANPFVLKQATVTVPDAPVETQPIPTTLDDDQILAFAVQRMRITGLVLRNGVAHLLINSASYREADLVPIRGSGDTVHYIRVVKITETEVTFGYNKGAMTIKLPN